MPPHAGGLASHVALLPPPVAQQAFKAAALADGHESHPPHSPACFASWLQPHSQSSEPLMPPRCMASITTHQALLREPASRATSCVAELLVLQVDRCSRARQDNVTLVCPQQNTNRFDQ